MEWTLEFIVSQIVTILMYMLLAITYYVKNRKTVLVISFLSLLANAIAYILLHAYTGLAMCGVALEGILLGCSIVGYGLEKRK